MRTNSNSTWISQFVFTCVQECIGLKHALYWQTNVHYRNMHASWFIHDLEGGDIGENT